MPASRRALSGSPGRLYPAVRILIADDDPCIRRLLTAALSARGFTVGLAASGAEALVLYARARGAFDVVLLDVHMPGALDCFETLAAFQRASPGVRCCFMSADADPQTVAGLLHGGALAVFSKPFRLDELAEGLRELAGREPAEAAGVAGVALLVPAAAPTGLAFPIVPANLP